MPRRPVLLALLVSLLAPLTGRSQERADEERAEVAARIGKAADLLEQMFAEPDRGPSPEVLDACLCVGVIPSMKKAGFALGARYGKGVVVCRQEGRGGWGAPAMVKLKGGSFGLQVGFAAIDVVMLVMSPQARDELAAGEIKVGADASVAAGPVGRSASAASQARLLSYSSPKGLFVGVELNGAVIRADEAGNGALHGRALSSREILLDPSRPVPAAAERLLALLDRHAPGRR